MKTSVIFRTPTVARALLAVGALFLGGCSFMDPYERPGVWRPSGVNEMNAQLQVVQPMDLVQGRGAADADGDTAAQAIDRLRADKVKELVKSSIATVGGS